METLNNLPWGHIVILPLVLDILAAVLIMQRMNPRAGIFYSPALIVVAIIVSAIIGAEEFSVFVRSWMLFSPAIIQICFTILTGLGSMALVIAVSMTRIKNEMMN